MRKLRGGVLEDSCRVPLGVLPTTQPAIGRLDQPHTADLPAVHSPPDTGEKNPALPPSNMSLTAHTAEAAAGFRCPLAKLKSPDQEKSHHLAGGEAS